MTESQEEVQEDSLDDEPIPTYEEFLDNIAKTFAKTPAVLLFKGAVELARYLFTREQLIINLLIQKDVLTSDEVEEYLGADAHEVAQERGVKTLTKYLLKSASEGQMVTPDGVTMRPDDVLLVLNDILDFNNTGYTGKTFETILEFRGESEDARKKYEKTVKQIEELNRIRGLRRKRRAEIKISEATQRELRIRKVRILISKCRVFDKPTPTDEEQQQMIAGTLPIPEKP